jgi:hypothetical protein
MNFTQYILQSNYVLVLIHSLNSGGFANQKNTMVVLPKKTMVVLPKENPPKNNDFAI